MSIKNYPAVLFSFFISLILILGWREREEYWLSAEKGWGYALGIIGGSLMLILLLYPLRKHWKLARNWFSIKHWFKMHMLFGVIGPVLILFHSNFQLGSLNSNIALFSMLLVSGSGIIGRYAYQKIHRGLYGEQIQFSELKHDYDKSKSHFAESDLLNSILKENLIHIEKQILQLKIPLFSAFLCNRKISRIQTELKKISRKKAKSYLGNKRELHQFAQKTKHLLSGVHRLKRMTNYALYDRIFSIWHVFHLPIFFMMILAGIIHVFAVHIY